MGGAVIVAVVEQNLGVDLICLLGLGKHIMSNAKTVVAVEHVIMLVKMEKFAVENVKGQAIYSPNDNKCSPYFWYHIKILEDL